MVQRGLQLEAEREFQFPNDEGRWLAADEGNEITPAHLSLDLEPQQFEELFHWEGEASFQGVSFVGAGEDLERLKLILCHVEERTRQLWSTTPTQLVKSLASAL